MIGAIFSGLTGLNTHQTRINVTGNNLANVNTPGFKKSRVTFRESFSRVLQNATGAPDDSSRGSTNPRQVGFGTQLGSIDTIHSDGNLQITGNPTDLALRGKGFFILGAAESTSAVTSADQVFTRAGNFSIDASGDLIYRPNGFHVLGWQAADGIVPPTSAQVAKINFPLGSPLAQQTRNVEFVGNLDTRAGQAQPIGGTISDNINAQTLSIPPGSRLETGRHQITVEQLQDGSFQASLDGGDPTPILRDDLVTLGAGDNTLQVAFSQLEAGVAEIEAISRVHETAIRVFDEQGTAHSIQITFSKAANNAWSWQVTPPAGTSITDASGAILFSASTGRVEQGPSADVTLTPPEGAAEFTFTLDFAQLAQLAADSDGVAARQNGAAPGTLTSFSIDRTGLITGGYSNGVTQSLAQIAIADVPNPEGLVSIQDTLFVQSASSGDPTPMQGGGNVAEVSAGSLELSNVNLTEEFTDLIITERGFQANSRVVTTADEILVEAIGLKR